MEEFGLLIHSFSALRPLFWFSSYLWCCPQLQRVYCAWVCAYLPSLSGSMACMSPLMSGSSHLPQLGYQWWQGWGGNGQILSEWPQPLCPGSESWQRTEQAVFSVTSCELLLTAPVNVCLCCSLGNCSCGSWFCSHLNLFLLSSAAGMSFCSSVWVCHCTDI